MKSHGKQYNHTPIDQRLWKVLLVNAETHSGGNDVPSGENVSSSEARRDGFVCSMWVYNYHVSALVLMVYWLVGRCISLKRKRTEYWWKLKTSLHGCWEEEKVECKNLAVGENTPFCASTSWVRVLWIVQYSTMRFVFMLKSKWSTCTRTYVLMKQCVFPFILRFSLDVLRVYLLPL